MSSTILLHSANHRSPGTLKEEEEEEGKDVLLFAHANGFCKEVGIIPFPFPFMSLTDLNEYMTLVTHTYIQDLEARVGAFAPWWRRTRYSRRRR